MGFTFCTQPAKEALARALGDTMSRLGTPPRKRLWGSSSCVKAPGVAAWLGGCVSSCSQARRPVRDTSTSCHSCSDTAAWLLQHRVTSLNTTTHSSTSLRVFHYTIDLVLDSITYKTPTKVPLSASTRLLILLQKWCWLPYSSHYRFIPYSRHRQVISRSEIHKCQSFYTAAAASTLQDKPKGALLRERGLRSRASPNAIL